MPELGDIKTGLQTVDHSGWIKLDGRLKSSLSPTQQSKATTLGFGVNIPDATDSCLIQNGETLGSTRGTNSKFISKTDLPDTPLSGTTTQGEGSHFHYNWARTEATAPFSPPFYNITNTVSLPNRDSIFPSYYGNPGEGSRDYKIAGSSLSRPVVGPSSGSLGTESEAHHVHTVTIDSINGGVMQTDFDITPQSMSVNTFVYLAK